LDLIVWLDRSYTCQHLHPTLLPLKVACALCSIPWEPKLGDGKKYFEWWVCHVAARVTFKGRKAGYRVGQSSSI